MGEYANLHLLRMNSREYSPSISNSFTPGLICHAKTLRNPRLVTSTASLIISISNESFTKRSSWSKGAKRPNSCKGKSRLA